MNLSVIKNGLYSAKKKALVNAAKHGPKALLIAGIAGATGALVLACVQTYKKAPAIVEDTKVKLNSIDEEFGEDPVGEQKAARNKAVAKVCLNTGWEFTKAYALPVGIFGLSMTCVGLSYGVEHRQKLLLANSYAAMSAAYSATRDKMREEVGEEREAEIHREVIESLRPRSDDEATQVQKEREKELRDFKTQREGSVYTWFFDNTNEHYRPAHKTNQLILNSWEKEFNAWLWSKDPGGVVYLNDVIIHMGFSPIREGWSMGWKRPKCTGLPYKIIDLGILNPDNPMNRAFINGDEPTFLIDLSKNLEWVLDELPSVYDRFGKVRYTDHGV